MCGPALSLNVFALFQSGLPAMNVEILSQFPSPPMPNLPALAMAMAPVMPHHQQPMMTHPQVSMAMPTPSQPVMAMTSAAPQAPANTNFIASFPPAQVIQHKSVSVFSSRDLNISLINSLTHLRGPKLTKMISRTSRRLQRQEPETRLSLSSVGRQMQISPPP